MWTEWNATAARQARLRGWNYVRKKDQKGSLSKCFFHKHVQFCLRWLFHVIFPSTENRPLPWSPIYFSHISSAVFLFSPEWASLLLKPSNYLYILTGISLEQVTRSSSSSFTHNLPLALVFTLYLTSYRIFILAYVKGSETYISPMDSASVRALKNRRVSDVLETSVANSICLNRYPWCLPECLKTAALIYWNIALVNYLPSVESQLSFTFIKYKFIVSWVP